MNGYTAARSRYIDDAVTTASPQMLLVMLYDRLLRDLERGEAALREGLRERAHAELVHAQDIVAELTSTLDVQAWNGAPQLMSLYTYLSATLIEANIERDADKVSACRELVGPLRDAWSAAARQVSEAAPLQSAGIFGVA